MNAIPIYECFYRLMTTDCNCEKWNDDNNKKTPTKQFVNERDFNEESKIGDARLDKALREKNDARWNDGRNVQLRTSEDWLRI